MNAVIAGEFGVEDRGQEAALLRGDDAPVGQGGENFGVPRHGGYQRGADEDGVEGSLIGRDFSQGGELHVGLEAGYLASKGVAFYGDVHQFQQGLLAVSGLKRVFGEEDRPSAGAPDGFFASEGTQLFQEAKIHGQFANRGRFSTGDDEAVNPF